MSTAVTTTTETSLGTLTWWHRGWLEYALRLETPEATHEAVEDSWFAALAAIAPQVSVPEQARAENPDQHREQWTRWLRETFG